MDSGDDTEKKGTQKKTELHEQRIRKKKLLIFRYD